MSGWHLGDRGAIATACALMTLGATAHAVGAGGGQFYGWGSNANGQSRPALPALLPYVSVCGGGFHSVAVLSDGTVRAWGDNFYGQGQTTDVVGVRRVAAGVYFTIAATSDGRVRAWGQDESGLFALAASITDAQEVSAGDRHALVLRADGTIVAGGAGKTDTGVGQEFGQSIVPDGLPAASGVAAGGLHSLALLGDGTVRAWGAGSPGTLGGPHFGQASVPGDLSGVASIAAGGFHSIAVVGAGAFARGWGRNDFGQRAVEDISQVLQVAAGKFHTVVLRMDGTVLVRGDNTWGQRNQPEGLAAVVQVAAGARHSIVLTADGTAVAWGLGTSGQTAVPSPVPSMEQIAAGGQHTVMLRSDGRMFAGGCNDFNQSVVPNGLTGVRQVAAGAKHTIALRADGTMVAWGAGETDSGTGSNHGQCVVPAGLTNVKMIAAGRFHTLAIEGEEGVVRAWGAGQTDSGSDPSYGQSMVPEGLTGATRVAGGGYHSVALVGARGEIRAWGAGGTNSGKAPHFGQCMIPSDLAGAIEVAAGGFHTLALMGDGTVRSWGGAVPGEATPPPGLSRVRQIAAGWRHNLALREDGSVVPWGRNDWGQISIPQGIADVTAVACGGDPDHAHSLVVLSSEASSCANTGGDGWAFLEISGSLWENVGAWRRPESGPQVPGALTDVTLGDYGSVGSLCDARCATLDVPAGSTLLVPVDLTQPLAAQDHSIDVGGLATLKGRVWLLASGAAQLPTDFEFPVLSAGTFDGYFSILQSNVPAPPGHFLTLVPGAGPGSWNLKVLPLPSNSSGSGTGATGAVDGGAAVAAEAMDLNGDGFDDLAVLVDLGAGIPGTLQVLLNDGAGNLGAVSRRQPTAPQPGTLAVGRLGGAGDALDDAVVGLRSVASARAFLNSGTASGDPFLPSTEFATGAPPTALTVLDPPDPLVVAGSSDSVVRYFAPTAPAAVQSTNVPRPPTTLDKRDRQIVSGGANPGSFGATRLNGMLLVLTPDPVTGAYPPSVGAGIEVPGIPVNVDVADIDRDGIADAITANSSPQQLASGTALGVLTLFKGTATGFGQPVPIAPAGATAGLDVAMVDVDADGVRDIVSVHQTVVGQSAAKVIPVNQQSPGGPLTLGEAIPIESDPPLERPILCPRGDVLGPGGEGVFIVDTGASAFQGEGLLGGGAVQAVPYRAEALPCVGDIDGDDRVSGIDLGALLGEWGMMGSALRADLNGDGTVSGADLGILVGAWGDCGG